LFQPFQRLSARRARTDGRHGLGLSIVRAIATAHGATITTKAPANGGLSISIAFPIPAPEQPETDNSGKYSRKATNS
jgi:signal transduction histidine kinase